MSSKKNNQKLKKSELKSIILNLVKRHGKIKILFKDRGLWEKGYRKRIIYRDGYCVVAYKSEGYTSFSNFTESCFMPLDYDKRGHPPLGLEETIHAMFVHDQGFIQPIQLQYGKWYRKRRNL